MGRQITLKCKVCGRLFEQKLFANKKQKYCTLKCRSKDYYSKYYSHFKWVRDRVCENCGKRFTIIHPAQKCCSETCRKKKWKTLHRQQVLEEHRVYNAKRKLDPIKHERDKEIRKKWRQNNKDKKYSYKRAYRARKYGNGGRHTKLEWEAIKYAYNYTCQDCGKSEPEEKMTEDHFIPLTRGGTDNIDNIQPLCKHCNSLKNDRILDSLPQT